ncbi:MAG TPA: glycosyltransferase family 4 protein [Gemmataceae bacterium]|nr:glycosyltransferase family 4 protein [Gemmataceae bacterium]
MRIAQVSPLYESVPPKNYGGTERIVSYLTEELVAQGHEVTLFASGDSRTKARLISPCPRSFRSNGNSPDSMAYSLLLLEQVFRQANDFDLIHFHIDCLHFSFCRREPCRQLTTLHGRLDLPHQPPLFREYAGMPVVSISDSQRQPLPDLNWQGTVYHGLPKNLHTFRPNPGDYLAFLGRICPEKGLDRAIKVAERFGMKIKVAAKIDDADSEYYESKIKPMMNRPDVEFLGEIGGKAKDDFLGRAYALLFPIDWPEPFGLVMIEAMACGTPVIAWPRGSVPEVMENGVTGYIVSNIAGAVSALEKVAHLNRKGCRDVFERRFSVARMVQDYLRIYQRLQESDCRNQEISREKAVIPLSADVLPLRKLSSRDVRLQTV